MVVSENAKSGQQGAGMVAIAVLIALGVAGVMLRNPGSGASKPEAGVAPVATPVAAPDAATDAATEKEPSAPVEPSDTK